MAALEQPGALVTPSAFGVHLILRGAAGLTAVFQFWGVHQLVEFSKDVWMSLRQVLCNTLVVEHPSQVSDCQYQGEGIAAMGILQQTEVPVECLHLVLHAC